ncbi:MAG: sensor domain-containing diguanylate cyclase [Erysipelotrichaceae bacterium]
MDEREFMFQESDYKLINNVPGGLAIYRIGETFETLYFNDGVCLLTGHTRSEYAKIINHDAMDIVYQGDQVVLGNEIKNAITYNRKINISYRIIHKNGQLVWVHLSGNIKNVEGRGLLIYAIFMDISDERKVQALLSERAEKDSLTGLLNRVGFETRITNNLSERKNRNSAFIMLDVDNFKQINDDYGHTSGDNMLCFVAEALTNIFYKDSYISRMGGDEFAVFVSDVESKRELNNLIEQFYLAIKNKQNSDINTLYITCSLGIALAPKDALVYQDLYANADQALFFAKRNGKNQYHFYSKGMKHNQPSLLSNVEWILDETSNGVYITNSETYELLYVNKVTKNLCNIKGDEYLGKKCYEALLGKTKPCEVCKLNKMEYDEFLEREYVIEKPLRYLILKGKLFNWNGIKAHVEFVTDNTQGSLIYKKYEKTANRLQALMDSIPGGIGIFEIEKEHITVPYLNDGFYKLVGFPVTDSRLYLGDFNDQLLEQNDLKVFYKELKYSLKHNTGMNINFRIKTIKNTYQWLNMQTTIVKQEDNKTTLYCSFTNVNSLKDSELEAKLQKNKFDVALNNTNICVWEYDVKENKIIQSSNSLKLYPFGEIIYDLPESIISKGYVAKDSIEAYRDLYRKIKEGNEKITADIHWIGFGKNKDWWARITYSLIFDDQGEPMIAMGATTDITNEKMAIKRYDEELENRALITPSTVVSFKMNLSNNKIEECILNDQKLAHFKKITSIDTLFDEIQNTLVADIDKKNAQILNRKRLIKKYNEQQIHIETQYRRSLNEGYIRFFHVTINLMKHPETNDIMAFIYTTDYTENVVIESAIHNFVKYYYDYIMFIDGMAEKYKIFDKKERLSYYHGLAEGSYYDYFNEFIKHNIKEEEQAKIRVLIDLQKIYQELELKDTYEVSFQTFNGNELSNVKELRYSYIDKETKKLLLAQHNLNRKNN